MKNKIIEFLPKLIIPVGVIIAGVLIYNSYLKQYKDKILKFKYCSPEFYLNWIKSLTKQQIKKYKIQYKELYNSKYKEFLKAFVYDLKKFESEQNNKIVEFLLILPMLFDENPAKFNNSFIWLNQNIKYKIQFSKLVSDCFIYGKINIIEEFINKGSKDFHRNLYNFLKSLKDVK